MSGRDQNDRMLSLARTTVRREISALEEVVDNLGAPLLASARLLIDCKGLVWVTGVGTSAMVGQRFAHILSCCGVRSVFLSPADGLHGHSAVFREADLLIAMSRGGESAEVIQMAEIGRRMGSTTLAFVHSTESRLARTCDQVLPIQSPSELELMGYLATTSTIVFSAVCDGLCAIVADATGFNSQLLAKVHPGGAVGQELAGEG